MTNSEMTICNQLVELVDEHSENGKLTNSNRAFECQGFMAGLRWAAAQKGFELLGSGYFSGVFSHWDLHDKVIKVGLKKEDSGAAYAAWCRANQHLEGVPKIHHISRHASCYIVVLDRLEPFASHVNTDYCGEYEGEPQNEEQQALIDAYESARRGIYGADNTHEEYTGIFSTCREIGRFFSGVASFDLHDENVMIDPKTKKLVITDPVSFVQAGLNGFDTEISGTEIAKIKRKEEAISRLNASTFRLALEADSRLMTKVRNAGWHHHKDLQKKAVNRLKLYMAIDQLRQIPIDLDRRLDKQFLRG